MDPTLSEIRLFAGNFAPLSWAFCNGALLSIAENTALFSLLGTTYGGDGQTTFALPDLRGRVAVGTFQGPGLSNWDLGQVEGTEAVTLITTQLPVHTHAVTATVSPFGNNGTSTLGTPIANYYSAAPADLYGSTPNGSFMGPSSFTLTIGTTGGSQPHDNMMPYLALNFIIAVEGIYPSRN